MVTGCRGRVHVMFIREGTVTREGGSVCHMTYGPHWVLL